MPDNKTNITKWILAGILMLCIISYWPLFNNDFTNWDDPAQVVNNVDVHGLSFEGTNAIFSSFYIGMYQPFTMQVYAFIYEVFGENATAFHCFSLFIHLINILLVFMLIKSFSRNETAALITAALFAFTPLQVESVAWVSALSNLLYTTFFLGGTLTYLQYIRKRKIKFLLYTLILFLISLLSKPTAVTFPVLLLFIDLYYRRRFNLRLIIEKAPFFIFAITIGVVILFAREEAGHIIDISERFDPGSRVLMFSYTLAFYIAKLFAPTSLSAFHPYPSDVLPIAYYIAPLIPLMLIFLVFRLRGEPRRQVKAGLLFFLLTIAIVLEIIPVGIHIVKERYVYMPSIGIYYTFAVLILFFTSGRRYGRWMPGIVTGIMVIIFSITSFSRVKTWQDSLSLWNDVLDEYPEASAALINRGNAWQAKEDLNRAVSDYSLAIRYEPQAADAYMNRALAYHKLQEMEKSMQDFNKAILLGIQDAQTYNNRGLLRASANDIPGAIADFEKACTLDPTYTDAWINKGLMHANSSDFRFAFNAFSDALRADPSSARAYYWRGMVQLSMGQIDDGCRDLKTATSYGWPQDKIPQVCQ